MTNQSPSMPQSDIRQILSNMLYNSATHDLPYEAELDEATQAIQALITEEVQLGRIDELERIVKVRDANKFTTIPGQYLNERLKELEDSNG